ncbi:hypothetical protein RMCBS344292_07490 [Rhizopus microsporus]|nr:hypothetical protein RMCBS344292_07490 [Rhizopus microsporus]
MGTTDSKLAFRKGVFRLFEERNLPKNMDDYWTLFWTLPESIDDVYTLISIHDIRRTRDTAIENLETLIDRLLEHMNSILNSANTNQNIQLLNCCRILSRVMPFIFESPEHAEWEDRFFWTPRLIERERTEDGQKPQYDSLPPRGEMLLSLCLKSLFLAGFTIPSSIGTADNKVNYVIWETGVGCSTPIGSSRDNDMNRIEVLRLLTVLLSKSMYTTPTQIISKEDRWLTYMITKIEKKIVLAFLCSMINISCKYNPLGWTVVPYNHIMFSDPRELLVGHCLRILLIILDYRLPLIRNTSSTDVIVEKIEDLNLSPTQNDGQVESSDNIYRYYLSKLHRAQDFQFLIDGIYRILDNPMQTLNNYIPGSLKRARYHVEMLMLCWKLLETNTRFNHYLMETERGLDLMVVLVFYANENKLDPSQVGLVRMCAFMLQTLSSNRLFGVKINKSFDGHASLPASSKIPNFQGTYADYLILSIFSLIATSRGTLSTLYPAFIMTITNISPYLKSISPIASSKLIALFSSMSAPGFLLADEANHKLIKYLLEAFNNMIRFQFSFNSRFVYTLVRNALKFQKLADFNLDAALSERSSNIARKHATDDEAGLSEKAKGKLPEGSTLTRHSSSSSQLQSNNVLFPGIRNGFIPTQDWVNSWHSQLPLDTILSLIDYLKLQLDKPGLTSDQIVEYISNLSLSDIPLRTPAHPVTVRKFQWTDTLMIWFQSMLWGHTYISSVSNYGPWTGTQIKLFHIKQQQPAVPDNTPPLPASTPASGHSSRPSLTTSRTV